MMLLETLDTLLRLALIQHYHDKAKAKKMTIKLIKKVHPTVKTMVVDPVLASSDPKGVLTEHALHYIELNKVAGEINDLGFPGMVVHDGVAYPVRLVIEDVHDRAYCLQNERVIAQKTASRFEEETSCSRSRCDVQFFKNRGFTGTRFQVPVGA